MRKFLRYIIPFIFVLICLIFFFAMAVHADDSYKKLPCPDGLVKLENQFWDILVTRAREETDKVFYITASETVCTIIDPPISDVEFKNLLTLTQAFEDFPDTVVPWSTREQVVYIIRGYKTPTSKFLIKFMYSSKTGNLVISGVIIKTNSGLPPPDLFDLPTIRSDAIYRMLRVIQNSDQVIGLNL